MQIVSADDVIKFWFEACEPKQWFTKSDDFDALLVEKFEATYWSVLKGETVSWRNTAEGRLAEIIVLDQFARNMFRRHAQAFAGDALALRAAQEMVALGLDEKLTPSQQSFAYMPFMHSESRLVHQQAVKLFTQLGNEMNLEYEFKHQAIIEAFGRYPHRNEALGRESTPAEIEFMKSNSGF